MAARVPEVWSQRKVMDPVAFAWTGTKVRADDGGIVDGVVPMELPRGTADFSDPLRQLAEKTNAFALLLIHEKEDRVYAHFESRFGSRTWKFRVHRHGDHHYVGKDPVIEVDQVSLGVLWRKP